VKLADTYVYQITYTGLYRPGNSIYSNVVQEKL